MKPSFSNFIKKTSSQIQRMRETISELKKERKEVSEMETPAPRPKNKKEEVIVHFSMLSVAKATVVILVLVVLANFIGQIANIILALFVSILFAAALDPTIDYFEKRRVPRSVSVVLIFIFMLSVLGFFISQLIPLVASQLFELARSLSGILNKLIAPESDFIFSEAIRNFFADAIGANNTELFLDQLTTNLESLGSQLQAIAGDTFVAIKKVFNGILNFFLVLILTFFIAVDEKGVDKFFLSLFPSKHGTYIVEKTEAVKLKVGMWLRGQVILMVIMFLIFWLVYSLLGLDYALTLAMMAGIGELIPVLGVFIAAVPALLVAFNHSPWLMLWTLIITLVIQQIEGNLLVPLVMKKAVGLSPIIVILAMLVGFQVLGVLGAIIAVPVATIMSIFVLDYSTKKK